MTARPNSEIEAKPIEGPWDYRARRMSWGGLVETVPDGYDDPRFEGGPIAWALAAIALVAILGIVALII